MVFDIILLAIILICAYFGYKRGFVRTLCGLGSLILSAVVSLFLYDDVAAFIKKSAVGGFITEKCFDSLAATDLQTLPEIFRKGAAEAVGQLQNTAAENMAHLVITIIAAIVTFVVVRLAVKLLFNIFNLVAKLPVLKQFNRLFGLLLGILNGIFWLAVVTVIVSYVSLLPEMAFLKDITANSQVLGWVFGLGIMPEFLLA